MITRIAVLMLVVLVSSCSKEQKIPPATSTTEHTVATQTEAVSASDTTLARQYFTQAGQFTKEAKYDSAIVYLQKASVIYEAKQEWEKYVACYNKIGDNYQRKGAYEQAMHYLNQALEIGLKQLVENHIETANSYHNAGIVYYSSGKYDQAIEYYNRALNIRLILLGDQHLEVVSSYNNLGNVYFKKGAYDQALAFYEKALAIWPNTLGEQHREVANTYLNLGNIYYMKGAYSITPEKLSRPRRC